MHALYCQYVHRMDVENKVKLPDIVVPDDDELVEQYEHDADSEADDDITEDDLDDDSIDDDEPEE